MKSHIFDTENTFHTFLLLIPKGSMIRLNIRNMYPMINPRKQHKAALDGGAQARGVNESFGICHGAQNDLHRIKSRLNQTESVLSNSDKKLAPSAGWLGDSRPFCVIFWNMNWNRASEKQDGPPWESVPILDVMLSSWSDGSKQKGTFFCDETILWNSVVTHHYIGRD